MVQVNKNSYTDQNHCGVSKVQWTALKGVEGVHSYMQ